MSNTIDSSDMELALAELRFKADFVLVFSREVEGRTMQKRTPRLTYWRAVTWIRMFRSVETEADIQINGATKEVLRLPVLQVLPIALIKTGKDA